MALIPPDASNPLQMGSNSQNGRVFSFTMPSLDALSPAKALFYVTHMNSPHLTAPTDFTELRALALQWVGEIDASRKAKGAIGMATSWQAGDLTLNTRQLLVARLPIPGRPAVPELISPKFVKHRSMLTVEGRAAMIHALTHIEFNAINLALDAIWRFADMPAAYYVDWLQVAGEEALHYSLLAAHLQTLGYQYGDFPAHNSMWEMADKTSDDILARMALVPRTLEARGLDATPRTRNKLAQAGDHSAAAILDIILRDEIGHVAIGNHWYKMLCDERGFDPVTAYASLTIRYNAPVLKGPFNLPARRAAGFSEIELTALMDGVPSTAVSS